MRNFAFMGNGEPYEQSFLVAKDQEHESFCVYYLILRTWFKQIESQCCVESIDYKQIIKIRKLYMLFYSTSYINHNVNSVRKVW